MSGSMLNETCVPTYQRKLGVHLDCLCMLVQGGEVSVIDGHVDMLTTPACRKSLVLVRMVLHVAGCYAREARMHGSDYCCGSDM